MKSLALKMQRFLVSEDGPTAVEYAVMLALIVIVCLTAIRTIGTNANTTFDNVGKPPGKPPPPPGPACFWWPDGKSHPPRRSPTAEEFFIVRSERFLRI